VKDARTIGNHGSLEGKRRQLPWMQWRTSRSVWRACALGIASPSACGKHAGSCVGITPTSKSGKMYEMKTVDRLRSSEFERGAPVRVYLEAVLSTLPSSNFPQARQNVRSVLYVPIVLRWSRTTSS
jgi:hypothetical protein